MKRSGTWWLVAVLCVVAGMDLLAEAYLASFGPPAMDARREVSLAALAYDLRHVVVFLLPLLLFPGGIAVALWGAGQWLNHERGAARTSLIRAGVLILGAVLLGLTSAPARAVRESGLHRAAVRMSPLVDAVERFERDFRRPPGNLSELVPGYLSDTRSFGVRGCRPLQYSTREHPARWELRMECPRGWITLDQFYYRPDGQYDVGPSTRRVDGWAYFWD